MTLIDTETKLDGRVLIREDETFYGGDYNGRHQIRVMVTTTTYIMSVPLNNNYYTKLCYDKDGNLYRSWTSKSIVGNYKNNTLNPRSRW